MDFSLIALRADHIKDSLVAADVARAMNLTSEQRAAAWFNTGLACGKRKLAPLEDVFSYCKEPEIMAFLTSWQTAPSRARENKVAELLDEISPQCIVEIPGKAPEQYYRIYPDVVVRHSRESPPPPDVVEFPVNYSGERGVEIHRTYLAKRYEMQGFTVSILRGDPYIQGTIRIRQQECALH